MKPIIFSTDMVRAILNGRKTMTRRVVKPQPKSAHTILEYNDGVWSFACGNQGDGGVFLSWCEECKEPYSEGDILWVRETWAKISDWSDVCPETGIFDGYIYKADWPSSGEHPKWRPSIHMPREAARIFLRVTDVRVERLQEMPLYDVWDEGTPQMPGNVDADGAVGHEDFKYLWDSLNAKRGYGWDKNPFCWVISFERISKDEALQ